MEVSPSSVNSLIVYYKMSYSSSTDFNKFLRNIKRYLEYNYMPIVIEGFYLNVILI